MSETALTSRVQDSDDLSGLYVTDAEIIRRLGFGEKKGRRILKQLQLPNKGRKPYPQPDPLFGGRRFWPAVFQWHLDYHRVRTTQDAPTVQPMWQENFDATPSRETRKSQRPRPELAKA